jgi:putative spermidine/putrescine transport system substrate-binding protein
MNCKPIAFHAAAAVAFAGLCNALPAMAQDTLTVTSWAARTKSQEKAFMEPFAKATGKKVLQDEWDGSPAKIKGMVETKQVTWDVVDVEPSQPAAGLRRRLAQKIDYSKLGGKDKFIDGAAYDIRSAPSCSARSTPTTPTSSRTVARRPWPTSGT